MSIIIEVGDLVYFGIAHEVGIVLDKRSYPAFEDEDVQEILVLWCGGETFWCLDFVLTIITKAKQADN